MIRWPDGARKKTDEDQPQPTVRNTLRILSRPANKNCPMADRRLGVFLPLCITPNTVYRFGVNWPKVSKHIPSSGEKVSPPECCKP
ncbi:hypothetical protein DPX16_13543 [Anabarilius grahami]|uniref:Uncharacterized protein n=1 Tax=Anabarilius grahami TaxID=495550 RepID=A0A3N0YBM9_ANAGA|nr:hypothetical protein DPX16_13543 [Anabarilius grahami]